jgi:hypothetical protein
MQCKVLRKIVQCKLMFVLMIKDLLVQFCNGCFINMKPGVLGNCVTLSFRNTEMYSRNYVANYDRKYFWINILCKKGLVKSPHLHKCYINMLMNLNNCMQ